MARTDPDAVHVEGLTFRDGRGRQLLFRGHNAKASPVFDATFDDGRTANETFQSFDAAGGQRFEELAFDVLRLPVNWSGLEPHPMQYSDAFLAKVVEILGIAKRHHFWVFIDMHEDAYSKEFGEDGQPLWAIVPPPPTLLIGAREHFEHARQHDGEYVRPWKQNLIDVCVSKELLERGLKIASDFYLALEDRGQRVVLAPASAHYRHKDVSTREDQKEDRNYGLFSSTKWRRGRHRHNRLRNQ